VKKKSEVAAQFRQHLSQSKRALSDQYDNTRKCQDFYSANTMDWEDRIQYQDQRGKRRALVRFNKVMPFVDAVAGFFAQQRNEVKYYARIPFKEKQETFTKYMNATRAYIRDNCRASYIESEQDNDMLVVGYGAIETDLSYVEGKATSLPGGEILKQRLDPRCTFWDGRAKRKNMTDARYVGYWQDYNIDDALALFPGSDDGDFGPAVIGDDSENYYYNPYGGRYDKISFDNAVEWATTAKDQLVRVYNYQWFEYETFYRADNPAYSFNSPEAVSLAIAQMQQIAAEQDKEWKDLFDFDPSKPILTFDSAVKTQLVEIFGKYIEPVRDVRKAYYTAVISGSHVFTVFRSVCQDAFSILFKTGTFDPTRRIWTGMVNNMMEPQLYYNKAITELMFTIASNSKGGVIIEEGAVEDIAEFEAKYAATNSVVVAKQGAVSGSMIMPKGQNVPLTGLDEVIQLTDANITDASGVNKAFLGSSENAQETGILYRRKIRQVVSTLAKYFDSIALYQDIDATNDLSFMAIWAENNEGEEIELQEGDGQYDTFQITQDKFLAEYGVTVREAPQTPEDRWEMAETIIALGDKVALVDPVAGKKIWGTAVQYLNLDSADKAKLKAVLSPEEGEQQVDPAYVQQLEQQLQQVMGEAAQAEIQKTMSATALDMAKVEQTLADVKLKGANTAKSLEEAQQKDVETSLMRSASQVQAII
jgi:hypothetical protein